MELHLVRTPDIAAEANRQRTPNQIFIGFAAESQDLETYGAEKIRAKGFDILFANPINEQNAGFGSETNRGILMTANGQRQVIATASKEEIARAILEAVAERGAK